MLGRLWGVLALVALVLVAMVALRPLLPIDETRYLAVAWEMRLSGDPAHLTRNFAFYTHKTPLLFVLINLVWLLTGVSEFAARLVGPALGLGMVEATALLARRLWPDRPGLGLRAAVILSGFTVFLIYASATMFDTLLGLAVLAGVAVIWRIGQGGAGRRHWAGLGLVLAFGVYAKGPVILVHLLPLLLTAGLWAPQPPRLAEAVKGLGLAVLVALALVAVWLVPTLLTASPAYRTELLWTQSAARVAGGMAHDRPVWFLAALLPLMLFPWGWSRQVWAGLGPRLRGDGALRLCAIWAASTLLLFSLISGKQVHYLLPAFPAVALIFAAGLPVAPGRGGALAAAPLLVLAGAAAALGFGAVALPKDLAGLAPLWPLLAFATAMLALAGLVWRLPLVPGHLLAGIGLALGLHGVIWSTSLHAAYDSAALVARLAPHVAGGLATTNSAYNAEVNFALRLTHPVATPATPAALADWARAHPQGMIFGLKRQDLLTAEPQEVLRYMGRDWALWPAAAAVTFPE